MPNKTQYNPLQSTTSTSSPPSPQYSHTIQQPYNYPEPNTRRSSICTNQQHSPTFQHNHHRRSRSFRETLSPTRQPTTHALEYKQPAVRKRTKPITRPPPLNVFTHHTPSTDSTLTSCSSSGSTSTTFFNTSTDSNASSYYSGTSTPRHHSRFRSSPSSSHSITSEYSTTSSGKQQQAAMIAAAGGKLAYLASRRGSSGSINNSGTDTPPNTPGGKNERKGGGRRRQSSGNFLEVPFNPGTPKSPDTSPTQPIHHRPRVNSLPAQSLLPSPTTQQRMRYANVSPTQRYFEPPSPNTLFPTYNHAAPYNPRSSSMITKSQDHLYRLRTFNITKGGDVVNCGDTFVRKSKSNNCINEQSSVSPRKCSLSASPTASVGVSSRRGSLSPRLVQPFGSGCCVLGESSSSMSEKGSSDVGEEEDDDDEEEEEYVRVRRGFEDDDDDLTTMKELGDDDDDDESVLMMMVGGSAGRYRVVLLGDSGVGKSSLVRQFMTSEYINTYDMSLDEEYGEREVSVLLDSKESQLVFIDHPCVEMSVENSLATYQPHACVVVYSVTDRNSFEFAGEALRYLWQEGTSERSVILVGNKCDLEKARVVGSQEGKQLATSHETKFIETSSGIQHNVDELLVGVLKQIRLREEANNYDGDDDDMLFSSSSSASEVQRKDKRKSKRKKNKKATPRGSIMNLLFTRELINKLCFLSNKAKSCENLHVL